MFRKQFCSAMLRHYIVKWIWGDILNPDNSLIYMYVFKKSNPSHHSSKEP